MHNFNAPKAQANSLSLLSSGSVTRNYEVAALRSDGSIFLNQFRAPALPFLDSAFSAFAHGALLATPDGLIAIEDLQPGDFVKTSRGEPAQVTWIGSTTFTPQPGVARTPLVRIMADSLGPGRPGAFVTVGPSARVLQTPPHLRAYADGEDLLTPANEFVDNVNVIEIYPPTPVRLFHICLTRHAAVDVGGIYLETFHPGSARVQGATLAQRDFLLSMFPRISHITDFGPLAHQRAPERVEDSTAA